MGLDCRAGGLCVFGAETGRVGECGETGHPDRPLCFTRRNAQVDQHERSAGPQSAMNLDRRPQALFAFEEVHRQ
jgi:hypothetical protein